MSSFCNSGVYFSLMNQSCLWTTEKSGSTLIALHQQPCIASVLRARHGVKLRQFHLEATVMSASLEMMQPCSTANSGNLFSSVVILDVFLMSFLPFVSV